MKSMVDINLEKLQKDIKQVSDDLVSQKNLLTDIRYCKDIDFTESIRRRTLDDIIRSGVLDNVLTDINTTSTVGLSTVSHASVYDRRLKVLVDGAEYYIGLYLV